jgi:hypothetical protein
MFTRPPIKDRFGTVQAEQISMERIDPISDFCKSISWASEQIAIDIHTHLDRHPIARYLSRVTLLNPDPGPQPALTGCKWT